MTDLSQQLSRRLYRHTCPPAIQLGEFELGMLSAAASAEILPHITACPHCQGELATLRKQLAEPAVMTEQEPPMTRAKLFVINLLRPTDTALQPQLVLRDGGEQNHVISHQLGPYLITLSWQADVRTQDKFTLIGDVTALDAGEGAESAEFHNWTAHLWQQDKLVGQHPIGIDGDLLIDTLDRANYHLVVTGDDFEAHLQNLTTPE